MQAINQPSVFSSFQCLFSGYISKETGEKVFLGMSTGVGSIAIKQVLNILFIPLMITTLGFEAFSLFMLMVGLQEVSLFLDCGLSQTLIAILSKENNQPENLNKKQTVYHVAFILYVIAALFMLSCGLVLKPFFTQLFHVPSSLVLLANQVFIFMLLEGILFLLLTFYRSVLMASCSHSVNNLADTLYHLIAFGAGALAIVEGYGLIGLMVMRLLAAVIRVVITVLATEKIMPLALLLKLKPNGLSQYVLVFKQFMALGKNAMVNNFSVVLSHKVDTIVIGLFLPLPAVGIYDIIFRLLGSAQQVCQKMSEMVLTLFASAATHETSKTARFLFLKSSGFNQMVISTLVILIVAFYPVLLGYLTNDTLSVESTWMYLALAIPIVWSAVLQIPASSYLFTSGHEAFLAKSSIVTAFANLLLSLILVKPFGLTGVILGTFIPQLIQHQFFLIRKTCQVLDISFFQYLLEVYWRGLAPVLLSSMILGTFVVLDWKNANLIWIALVGLVFALVNTVLWMAWRMETFQSLLLRFEINIKTVNRLKRQLDNGNLFNTVLTGLKKGLKKVDVR